MLRVKQFFTFGPFHVSLPGRVYASLEFVVDDHRECQDTQSAVEKGWALTCSL